ncbi:MAG: carboxymuconolactone decarboxylase family protein [Planctomycetota bacterium]|jgi:alkylhydroperoxidase/carboxymuconolactone decarboxylase family protein YurZ|nr:carboxymuconolactone decarboxylase family protein [Planctomycetota bacterium]MDP7253096.1 carboxymuconolactone decarboxylase family protein [Planctomycetota bacterium]
MSQLSEPPKAFKSFIETFPNLGESWKLSQEAGKEGPLDEKTSRLAKLAVAIGAMREGAVHSSVRKALALGITEEEILQVVALAAGTLGFPSAVAVFCWVKDITDS